jgi:hypothetical protein
MQERPIRSVDGILPPKPVTPHLEPKKRRRFARLRPPSKKAVVLGSSGLLLVINGTLLWCLFLRTPADKDPFTPQVAVSVQFPLYYPKYLPPGFRIDGSSVSQPQTGVVIFDLKGPNNQKVYLSEEARPGSYDIGGFFKKFSGLKEYGVSGGTVAVGMLDGGQTVIGSMLTGKVWLIANTNDQSVTPAMMNSLVKSLVVNGSSR